MRGRAFCFQVAELAKELKRERLALSKAQQVRATRSTAGVMAQPKDAETASLLKPPPAPPQSQTTQGLAGVMANLNFTGLGSAPAAPAVAAREVPAGGGAGGESQAGSQLAQVGEDKPPQTEGRTAGDAMTDAECVLAHMSLLKWAFLHANAAHGHWHNRGGSFRAVTRL